MNPRPNRAGRSFRIGSAAEFQRVFARKTRRDLGWIIVHAAPNELGRTRLGLSIGVRVGNAARRVRVKRLIRESFRLVRAGIPRGIDIIVSSRNHADRPIADYMRAITDESKRLATALGISTTDGE